MNESEYLKIPNQKEAKEAIKRIKQKGFPKFSKDLSIENYIKEVTDLITSEFWILPNLIVKLPRENFRMNLFRVRPLDQIRNIDQFSEHSYPPAKVVGFGRCNFPKHPVFYSSNNPMTALLEVTRETEGLNQYYCISKWQIHTTNDINYESFILAKLIEESDYDELRESQKKHIRQIFRNKLTFDQIEGLILLREFLDRSFISDSSSGLSASLAHRSIYAPHNLKSDILIYPSSQTQYTGLNFAINPKYVDDNMRLTRFYIMELLDYIPSERRIHFKMRRYGQVNGDEVIWKEIRPDDFEYKADVKEDFGDIFGPESEWKFEKV